jgi:hypothetical protein
VTEFRLLGTKAYLSPAIELHNGEVIAYTIRDHPDLPMVLDMVDIAVRARPGCKGVILHSDQGSLYQSARYREKLATAGIVQSMSRKGNCYDNACAESFFSRLKAEFDYASFNSMDQFKAELHKFIRYYNEERIKSRHIVGCLKSTLKTSSNGICTLPMKRNGKKGNVNLQLWNAVVTNCICHYHQLFVSIIPTYPTY